MTSYNWQHSVTTGSIYISSLIMSLFLIGFVQAENSRHHLWNGLLSEYVSDDLVDYRGFRKDQGRLNAYLKELEKTDVGSLSRDEQLALYI